MLQRSPTYIVTLPAEDPLVKLLSRFLPKRAVYAICRWKNVLLTMASFQLSRRRPRLAKALIRKGVERHLPPGYDVKTHFRPRYNPWQQRLCLVPDGDLFQAISSGRASMVTDEIESFTEKGLELASGQELEADLIVTATGLNLLALGGISLSVDGREVEPSEHLTYKGMMLSDVPNMAFAVGYTNASWTLKCELTCEYVCRLLNHMDEHGYRVCTPHPTGTVEPEPLIDFNSGYVLRGIHLFPKQGSRPPWRLFQNYPRDVMMIRWGRVADEELEFSGAGAPAEPAKIAA
jgi:cation diffusion facilitator CzcD-associated flavoprotein CzcO